MRIVVRPRPSTYSITTDSTPMRTRRYCPAITSPSRPRIVVRQSLNAATLPTFGTSIHPMYFSGIGGGGGGPISAGGGGGGTAAPRDGAGGGGGGGFT